MAFRNEASTRMTATWIKMSKGPGLGSYLHGIPDAKMKRVKAALNKSELPRDI